MRRFSQAVMAGRSPGHPRRSAMAGRSPGHPRRSASRKKTLILWLGPALLLLLGAGGIYALLRRRPAAALEPPLSETERRRLAELTAEQGDTAAGSRG